MELDQYLVCQLFSILPIDHVRILFGVPFLCLTNHLLEVEEMLIMTTLHQFAPVKQTYLDQRSKVTDTSRRSKYTIHTKN